jgi:hypothetical protein
MPTVSEMTAGKYLTKEECDPAIIVTIKGFKRVNVAKEDQDPRYKWTGTFDELQKPMVWNKTNLKRAEKIFGSDHTDDWIGKKIMLYNDPEVEMSGEQVGGIRVRPATTKVKPKQAEGVDEFDVPF